MPRFSYEDADKYGSSSNKGSFFQLKDDGDTALVHLLGNSMKDFPGYAVHRVPVGEDDNGKTRYKYVNCLREAGEPVDVCPFCAEGKNEPEISKVHAKLFIPLYNIDADEVQTWERGKSFFRELSSYVSHTPKCSEVVTEIERRGKANDKKTTYGLYEKKDAEDDGFNIDNIRDDIPEILGDIVLDKTESEMEYYLKHGHFESDGADSRDSEVRRRGDSDRDNRDRQTSRRTPSRSRNNEDDY